MALDIVQHMLPTTSQWLEWSTRHPGWDELTTRTSDAMLITGKDNTYALIIDNITPSAMLW